MRENPYFRSLSSSKGSLNDSFAANAINLVQNQIEAIIILKHIRIILDERVEVSTHFDEI
jgi:hypothetical protein